MATCIHPTAVVDPGAALGRHVVIGPFCVVEAEVTIGDECVLEARAMIKARTTLGRGNHLGEGAVLGGAAQSLAAPHPGGSLTIGDRNQIRENVTIHRSAGNTATTVQDDNLFMVSSHVGHDCRIGSRCTLVNHVLLEGDVELQDGVCLGGASSIAAHCRIGRLAMIGAMTRLQEDVPPYVLVSDSQVIGLNRVGLARNGFSAHEMRELKAAYQVIYRRGLRWQEVLTILQAEFCAGPAAEFHRFLAGGRHCVQERRLPQQAALRVVAPPDARPHTGQRTS